MTCTLTSLQGVEFYKDDIKILKDIDLTEESKGEIIYILGYILEGDCEELTKYNWDSKYINCSKIKSWSSFINDFSKISDQFEKNISETDYRLYLCYIN